MKPVYFLIFFPILIGCFDTNDPIDVQTLTVEEQFEIDTTLIEDFLTQNEIAAEVHESGIRFVVMEEGTGVSPTVSDDVTVKYEGRLLSGERFDFNQEGITFPLGSLIPAWQIMIPEVNEGGQMTIYAPSIYCYGAARVGIIPPNSVLIFDIELVEVPM